MKLWNNIGIGIDNSSFKNPAAPDRDVFAFADAPHLIKLIRNNFLDSGFQLEEGKYANCACVRELIQGSGRDLKPTHRLAETHICVKGAKRMAVQLLSETTAKALTYFGQRGLLHSMGWENTGQFMHLTDSWFDMFNSRVSYDDQCSRNAKSGTAKYDKVCMVSESLW